MKKIPEIRFPEFSGEWVEKRLGDVCDVRDGTHDSPKYIKEGYPLITSKNLSKNGKIDFSNVNYISKEDFEKINKRSKVNKGDILFGMIGTIGNPVIVDKEKFAIKNVALIKEKEQVINKFLFYYLNSNNIKKQFFKENTGGTQKFIALNVIRKLKLTIPPTLAEQKKIAEFLSSVDEKIEITAKKIEKLKDYKKGLLQKMLNVINGEPEIRFKEFSGKWLEKRLKEIGEIKKGIQLNRLNMIVNGKYPVINGGIKESGYTNNFNTEKNTITISEGGNSCGYINFIKTNFWCGGHCYKLDNIKTDKYFLYFILKKEENKIMKLRVGSGLPNIQKNTLLKFKIHIPPTLEEQQKIADFLSSIDEKIELNENRLKALKTYKKGLLQKMFV